MHEGRDRSLSGDLDDSDLDSHGDNPPGKPGRKKNPNSQAARRDQNRIAQREFRLRKQQRIRDLEARVEILSGGKDEALGEMRNMLKDLMAENQTLRNMLRSLSGFIGDGAGGLLPKLGWDLTDFNNYINKSETDTAWEGYQKRKKSSQPSQADGVVPSLPGISAIQGQKRHGDDDSLSTRAKKARNSDDHEGDRSQNGFNVIAPLGSSSIPSGSLYGQGPRPVERNGMFSELLRGTNASPMFAQSPTTSSTSLQYNTLPGNIDDYRSSYITGVNMTMEQPIPQTSYDAPSGSTSQQRMPPVSIPSEDIDDDDPNRNEAYKLIHYHLENYKRNSAYCLPSSLRPSVVQRSIPHESVIDGVLHPELRDRMILYRQRYEIVDCLMDYRRAVTIHGDDVLTHNNWEIGEQFLRKYTFLADHATINITNRWRKERGEPELRTSEFISDQPPPPA